MNHFDSFAAALQNTPAKGYLLEMFFIYKCNMALAIKDDDEAAFLTFFAQSFLTRDQATDKRFNIKFRNIVKNVDLEKSDDNVWVKGNVLVLKSTIFANF